MGMQTMTTQTGRLNKFKGGIYKNASVVEILAKQGRQVTMPQNSSDTYVGRRYLPYGAASTNANTINRFYADGTGDRANVVVQAHQTTEGVTGVPETISAVDTTVVIVEYSCLYGFTNKMFQLYEDDVPAEMKKIVGQRVAWVNELIVYGALRGCTNQYFAGGTTIATVASAPSLSLLRKVAKNLKANHAMVITRMLAASPKYATEPVGQGYIVVAHTNLEPDISDIPGFVPIEKYSSGTPMPNEIGKVGAFRFVLSPDLPELQDAGASGATNGLYCTTSTTAVDVYPMIVMAEDAYSQVAVRGLAGLEPTYLPPNKKDKADPHGQRGYAGTLWKKAVMIENNGWMAVVFVGSKILTT